MIKGTTQNSENIRKREYAAPKMKLVKLRHRANLLGGSLSDPNLFTGEGN